MNKTFEIEFDDPDKFPYVATFTGEAEWGVEDEGIGAYEFWGAPGNQVLLVAKCVGVTVDDAVDSDGMAPLVVQDPDVTSRDLENFLMEWLEENEGADVDEIRDWHTEP